MTRRLSIFYMVMMLLIFNLLPFNNTVLAMGNSKASAAVFQMASKIRPVDILISAAGDCTLGYDTDFGYNRSFPDVVSKKGFEYPFYNVRDIFEGDDITIVNLETTRTNAAKRAVKTFKFKGDPEYTKILSSSSVEVVNISNNHIYDYLEKGFEDTITNLQNAGVGFCGEGYKYIKEVKGTYVGFLGYTGWSRGKSAKEEILKDIEELKEKCSIVIVSFHWGIERDNYPNSTQKDLGRFCIDSGADLVLGHHPHVIQGIETYKGKHIVYSLGNFSFGGNKNPSDKDTFIFSEKFRVLGDDVCSVDTKIIPCRISSTSSYNDYQPTPLDGSEAMRVMDRLKKYCSALQYGYVFEQ